MNSSSAGFSGADSDVSEHGLELVKVNQEGSQGDASDSPTIQEAGEEAQVAHESFLAAFGLKRRPFAVTLDPDFLFPSPCHREALASLEWGVLHERGVLYLLGEVGTGKTLLLRSLVLRLGAICCCVILQHLPSSGDELVRMVLQNLGVEDHGLTRIDRLALLDRELLVRLRAYGRPSLIVLDEAQAVDEKVLEEVRLLSNLESGGKRLIQVLLAGQPELELRLRSHDLRQLRQRITVHATLWPLKSDEVRQYIEHRLGVAGRTEQGLFTPAAIETIRKASRGIPRIIDVLCEQGLVNAYGHERHEVDADLIKEAIVQSGFDVDLSWTADARPAAAKGPSESEEVSDREHPDAELPAPSDIEPAHEEGARGTEPRRPFSGIHSFTREELFLKVHARLRGIELPNDVTTILAASARSSQELQGILDRLADLASETTTPITPELLRSLTGAGVFSHRRHPGSHSSED